MPGRLEGTFCLPVKPGWYNKILMEPRPLLYLRSGGNAQRSPTGHHAGRPARPLEHAARHRMPPARSPGFSRRSRPCPPRLCRRDGPKTFLIESLSAFLNDAQELVDLEEAGTFDFFDQDKLEGLLEGAGWEIDKDPSPSYGNPPQGYIVVAKTRDRPWLKLSRRFEERLYQEYDLKGRVKLATIISMILFVSFLLLDWIYTPQHIRTFAIIRFSRGRPGTPPARPGQAHPNPPGFHQPGHEPGDHRRRRDLHHDPGLGRLPDELLSRPEHHRHGHDRRHPFRLPRSPSSSTP
ncbi:MAG: hypothetical protein MZU79_02460 [Anaerotruncus sp.]|nr:hypothetical protein [Anaerotruncus sp.]